MGLSYGKAVGFPHGEWPCAQDRSHKSTYNLICKWPPITSAIFFSLEAGKQIQSTIRVRDYTSAWLVGGKALLGSIILEGAFL